MAWGDCGRVEKTIQTIESKLLGDIIFIMIKASKQHRYNWLVGWAFWLFFHNEIKFMLKPVQGHI